MYKETEQDEPIINKARQLKSSSFILPCICEILLLPSGNTAALSVGGDGINPVGPLAGK